MPEQGNTAGGNLRDEFNERLNRRFIERSSIVVETDVQGQLYLPLLRNPLLTREDGTQELELAGGKIEKHPSEDDILQRHLGRPKGYLIAEARRELLEEMPIYAQATSLSVELMEMDLTILPHTFSRLKGDRNNLALDTKQFLARAEMPTLPVLPTTEEHVGGIWIHLPSWEDASVARDHFQTLLQQLNDYDIRKIKGLYVMPTQTRSDVVELVLKGKQLDSILHGESPTQYLPISQVTRPVLHQYFRNRFFSKQ